MTVLGCNDCGRGFAEEDKADDDEYWRCPSCGSLEVDEAPAVLELVRHRCLGLGPTPTARPRFHNGEIDEARPCAHLVAASA
jgi:hypothetical protein